MREGLKKEVGNRDDTEIGESRPAVSKLEEREEPKISKQEKAVSERRKLEIIHEELRAVSGDIADQKMSDDVHASPPLKDGEIETVANDKKAWLSNAVIEIGSFLVRDIRSFDIYKDFAEEVETILPMFRDTSVVLRSMYYDIVGYPQVVRYNTLNGQSIEVVPRSFVCDLPKVGKHYEVKYAQVLDSYLLGSKYEGPYMRIRFGGIDSEGNAVVLIGGRAEKIAQADFERFI